jgi:hypothetical protein
LKKHNQRKSKLIREREREKPRQGQKERQRELARRGKEREIEKYETLRRKTDRLKDEMLQTDKVRERVRV